MKRSILVLFLAFLLNSFLSGQSVPRFSKYQVVTTGTSVYLPGDPGEFEKTLSEDGSEVYTAEVTHDPFNYAVILVKFKEPIGDNKEENEILLESYLDFLQEQFDIEGSAGYGEGHTLESNPNAIGVIDFWEDTEGLQYNIQGWVDSEYLCVLMMYGIPEPEYSYWEIFRNGFRFP